MLIARLNNQVHTHANELRTLQDKIKETLEVVDDRGREIRAMTRPTVNCN
jgi:hypothetical protein